MKAKTASPGTMNPRKADSRVDPPFAVKQFSALVGVSMPGWLRNMTWMLSRSFRCTASMGCLWLRSCGQRSRAVVGQSRHWTSRDTGNRVFIPA